MNADPVASDHDQIYLVLPWYVNDTLEEREHESVVTHLESCSVCRQEVRFLTLLQSVSPRCDQIAQLPQAGLAATLRRIDRAESAPPQSSRWRTVLKDLLDSATGSRFGGWAAAMSVAIMVVVGGLHYQSSSVNEDPEYRTLSSDGGNAESPLRFRVRMVENMTEADALAFFERTGTRLEVIASDNGSYTLEMAADSEPAAAAALLEALKSSKAVSAAELVLN